MKNLKLIFFILLDLVLLAGSIADLGGTQFRDWINPEKLSQAWDFLLNGKLNSALETFHTGPKVCTITL